MARTNKAKSWKAQAESSARNQDAPRSRGVRANPASQSAPSSQTAASAQDPVDFANQQLQGASAAVAPGAQQLPDFAADTIELPPVDPAKLTNGDEAKNRAKTRAAQSAEQLLGFDAAFEAVDPAEAAAAAKLKKLKKKAIKSNQKKVTYLVAACIACVIVALGAVIGTEIYYNSKMSNLDAAGTPSNATSESPTPTPTVTVTATPSETATESSSPSPSASTETKKSEENNELTPKATTDPATTTKPASNTVGNRGAITGNAAHYLGQSMPGWELIQKALGDSGYPKTGGQTYTGTTGQRYSEVVQFGDLGTAIHNSKDIQPGDIIEFGNIQGPISADWMGVASGNNEVIMSFNGKVVKQQMPSNLKISAITRLS